VVALYARLLAQNRRWLAMAALFFALGLLGGFMLALVDPQRAGTLLEETLRTLRGTIGPMAGGTWQGVQAVFLNNLRATTIAMLCGIALGVVPALVLVANGVLLGSLVGLALTGATRIPLVLLPIALLPHGIIELPTLVLASAWGLKLGLAWLAPSASGQRWAMLRHSAWEALCVYALVLILLLIAATIEMLLTYALVRAVAGSTP
jgi:stage II sporulation protein M